MTTTTKAEDPQTYWKRIKVPAELLDAGWKLIKRDSTAPFALVNEQLDQDTGGYPDPAEAIAAGQALVIELAEAEAIRADGADVDGEPTVQALTVLPLALLDEGWRVIRRRAKGKDSRRFYAQRGSLQTAAFADQADAVAMAIQLEVERQAEIEAKELGFTGAQAKLIAEQVGKPAAERRAAPDSADVKEFLARGQAAQLAVDEIISNANGNGGGSQDQPAEIRLPLDRIRLDGGTQQRSLFDEAVLTDYAEAMAAGGPDSDFPAVEVFFDGASYWLADGFYRLEAHKQLSADTIVAHVRQGSQRDAILFSLGANARHGLPRTPDDKRRAVQVVLRDPEWSSWSDALIAERVRVSVPLVRKLRKQETEAAEAAGTVAKPATRKGRDGRVQDTTRIGTRAPKEKKQLALDAAAQAVEQKYKEAAAPVLCSDCSKEIAAGDFQSELGQCWDCTPNVKQPGAAVVQCSECGKEIAASDYNKGGKCWDCARGSEPRPRKSKAGKTVATNETAAAAGTRRLRFVRNTAYEGVDYGPDLPAGDVADVDAHWSGIFLAQGRAQLVEAAPLELADVVRGHDLALTISIRQGQAQVHVLASVDFFMIKGDVALADLRLTPEQVALIAGEIEKAKQAAAAAAQLEAKPAPVPKAPAKQTKPATTKKAPVVKASKRAAKQTAAPAPVVAPAKKAGTAKASKRARAQAAPAVPASAKRTRAQLSAWRTKPKKLRLKIDASPAAPVRKATASKAVAKKPARKPAKKAVKLATKKNRK